MPAKALSARRLARRRLGYRMELVNPHLVDTWVHRMGVATGAKHQHVAEALRESDLLPGVDLLIAQEQNSMLKQQPPQLITQLGGKWFTQIQPADLGTDDRARGRDSQSRPGRQSGAASRRSTFGNSTTNHPARRDTA